VNPTVSFVVPCYRLAHFLPDCINSILMQTYKDLEILIMDDCSPDNTAEVAQSFQDSRVKYIRNGTNLGHLRNYNQGITLSQGKYVWLISADDCLRVPYVLDRYVALLESHPEVGYVFCPGMGLCQGVETRIINSHGPEDMMFDGRGFLMNLLEANSIVAASGMARKECYEKVGFFPTDMPWAGDWYLWCVFALHYAVGYFAEPMVNYRTHDLSMTNTLMNKDPRICIEDDAIVLERTRQRAQEVGQKAIVNRCRHLMGYIYATSTLSPRYANRLMTVEDCDASAARLIHNRRELRMFRARFYACLGDQYCWRQQFGRAFRWYAKGLWRDGWMSVVWLKMLSLCLGDLGLRLRQSGHSCRIAEQKIWS
jgi:glycosyltransferase involved in cell wall biosynthesis